MSALGRLWAPATLSAVSTLVGSYAINILTAGDAKWWWWLVAVASGIGLIGGAIWWYAAEKGHRSHAESATPVQQSNASVQQSASGKATNVSINAEDGSAAALQMGDVSMGRPRKKKS
jgi:hypothetical protein